MKTNSNGLKQRRKRGAEAEENRVKVLWASGQEDQQSDGHHSYDVRSPRIAAATG
jgi:hypothetical protein